MRVNEKQIRNIIRKTLNEQTGGPDFYARKANKLRQALVILEQVRDDEAMAPGGGDEELEEVINMLSGLVDAVEAMG